jgi:acyl carrier protein phosphodiesterase
MNYLAHAYLSFNDPAVLAGNIFSDFVKGKKRFDFPTRIQQGISLHRDIDRFTDEHSVTAAAKQYFKPVYGLYSAAFVDIMYDHFLAKDESIFPDDNALRLFAANTYSQLKQSEPYFPQGFDVVFYYMQLHNWLYGYQYTEGIFRSFGGLVRRATYMHDAQPACDLFIKHYDELRKCYEAFFPELKAFATQQFSALHNSA